jgi:hypothetical protein
LTGFFGSPALATGGATIADSSYFWLHNSSEDRLRVSEGTSSHPRLCRDHLATPYHFQLNTC